jgi:hypothetical protein
MDEAVLVHLAKGCGNADGDVQERSHPYRHADARAEQIAAKILEEQNGPAAISHKLDRPRSPGAVQLIFQGVFVGKAIESGRSWLFRGRE